MGNSTSAYTKHHTPYNNFTWPLPLYGFRDLAFEHTNVNRHITKIVDEKRAHIDTFKVGYRLHKAWLCKDLSIGFGEQNETKMTLDTIRAISDNYMTKNTGHIDPLADIHIAHTTYHFVTKDDDTIMTSCVKQSNGKNISYIDELVAISQYHTPGTEHNTINYSPTSPAFSFNSKDFPLYKLYPPRYSWSLNSGKVNPVNFDGIMLKQYHERSTPHSVDSVQLSDLNNFHRFFLIPRDNSEEHLLKMMFNCTSGTTKSSSYRIIQSFDLTSHDLLKYPDAHLFLRDQWDHDHSFSAHFLFFFPDASLQLPYQYNARYGANGKDHYMSMNTIYFYISILLQLNNPLTYNMPIPTPLIPILIDPRYPHTIDDFNLFLKHYTQLVQTNLLSVISPDYHPRIVILFHIPASSYDNSNNTANDPVYITQHEVELACETANIPQEHLSVFVVSLETGEHLAQVVDRILDPLILSTFETMLLPSFKKMKETRENPLHYIIPSKKRDDDAHNLHNIYFRELLALKKGEAGASANIPLFSHHKEKIRRDLTLAYAFSKFGGIHFLNFRDALDVKMINAMYPVFEKYHTHHVEAFLQSVVLQKHTDILKETSPYFLEVLTLLKTARAQKKKQELSLLKQSTIAVDDDPNEYNGIFDDTDDNGPSVANNNISTIIHENDGINDPDRNDDILTELVSNLLATAPIPLTGLIYVQNYFGHSKYITEVSSKLSNDGCCFPYYNPNCPENAMEYRYIAEELDYTSPTTIVYNPSPIGHTPQPTAHSIKIETLKRLVAREQRQHITVNPALYPLIYTTVKTPFQSPTVTTISHYTVSATIKTNTCIKSTNSNPLFIDCDDCDEKIAKPTYLNKLHPSLMNSTIYNEIYSDYQLKLEQLFVNNELDLAANPFFLFYNPMSSPTAANTHSRDDLKQKFFADDYEHNRLYPNPQIPTHLFYNTPVSHAPSMAYTSSAFYTNHNRKGDQQYLIASRCKNNLHKNRADHLYPTSNKCDKHHYLHAFINNMFRPSTQGGNDSHVINNCNESNSLCYNQQFAFTPQSPSLLSLEVNSSNDDVYVINDILAHPTQTPKLSPQNETKSVNNQQKRQQYLFNVALHAVHSFSMCEKNLGCYAGISRSVEELTAMLLMKPLQLFGVVRVIDLRGVVAESPNDVYRKQHYNIIPTTVGGFGGFYHDNYFKCFLKDLSPTIGLAHIIPHYFIILTSSPEDINRNTSDISLDKNSTDFQLPSQEHQAEIDAVCPMNMKTIEPISHILTARTKENHTNYLHYRYLRDYYFKWFLKKNDNASSLNCLEKHTYFNEFLLKRLYEGIFTACGNDIDKYNHLHFIECGGINNNVIHAGNTIYEQLQNNSHNCDDNNRLSFILNTVYKHASVQKVHFLTQALKNILSK